MSDLHLRRLAAIGHHFCKTHRSGNVQMLAAEVENSDFAAGRARQQQSRRREGRSDDKRHKDRAQQGTRWHASGLFVLRRQIRES